MKPHVTNNLVQRTRLKIEKPKLERKIVRDYKRGNFKAVTSPPEFVTDSDYLMNRSKAQKKKVETFDSQDKERLVLENFPEDDDALNLQNLRISNKAIEKQGIREGVETSKENGVDIHLSFISSELLQDDKDLNV